MDQEKINEHLSNLFLDILSGEYTFPEFNSLRSKKAKKEYSLKAHSVASRLFKLWGAENGSEEDHRQTS